MSQNPTNAPAPYPIDPGVMPHGSLGILSPEHQALVADLTEVNRAGVEKINDTHAKMLAGFQIATSALDLIAPLAAMAAPQYAPIAMALQKKLDEINARVQKT